jgi:hypothetical protein
MAKPVSRRFTADSPEFCPNPACPYHDRETASNSAWFRCFGSFPTKTRGTIHRFICKHCGTTCSTQTFSIHYWTHSTLDLCLLDDRLYAGSGYRQIGRDTGLGYRVLKNRYQRIARNYLNLFDAFLEDQWFPENVAFDGFESFIRSQYFPVNYHLMVGAESQFSYMVNAEVLKRKGSMTRGQKQRREQIAEHWQPRRAGIRRSCESLFRSAASLLTGYGGERPWIIDTDMKKEYPLAMQEVREFRELMEKGIILHRKTSSRAARTRDNPLFPVNYLDRELRKNSASHVRETVRQDREVNMAMVRMIILLGHHGFRKPFRIDNRKDIDSQKTHADMTGLPGGPRYRWAFERLYTHRHVWSHQKDRGEWKRQVWKREYANPPVIDFRTGRPKEKGQGGAGWFARHLAV